MWIEIGLTIFTGILVRAFLQRKKDRITINGETVKPFHAIPGPGGIPFIGSVIDMYLKGYVGNTHKYLLDRSTQYGPIMKENMLGVEMVILFGVQEIEELSKKDGKYPLLFQVYAFEDYRRRHKLPPGIITSKGPEWKKLRAPWNHTMLKTTNVYSGIENLNDINTDFIKRIQERRNEKGIVKDIDRELFRWSLESVCFYLFETRFGCLSGNAEMEEFITAVKDMFLALEDLVNYPMSLAPYLARSSFKKHDSAWNTITKIAMHHVDAKVKEMAVDVDEGVEPTGFLSYVISSHQLTPEEIYSTVSEIMMAAVDTTSNSAQYILYELSINPEVQNKVYEEVCDVTGGEFPTADHLRKMDYLKATVRDVQRLHSVALATSRTIQEDIVIGGYHIPAKSTVLIDSYANGRNPELFKDPLKLKPERWMKDGGEDVNSFASAIFGLGSRGCIGRKTAETELHVLIARLLQKFELRYEGEKPLESCTKSVMVPTEPVAVSFNDRD